MMEEQQKGASSEQRNVVNFLRAKTGPKIRSGLLNGKRVDYFKGKGAIKALLSPEFAKQKKVPKITTEEEAVALLHSIIPFAFFLRVVRSAEGSPKTLQINPQQAFTPDGLDYYAWFYEGSQFWTLVGGVGMVAVMLSVVMYPLWPYTLRLGVYYLSMGVLALLGAFFAMAILRLIFYVITLVVAKPGIWVFPRLFEDVSFMDSWTPLYAWDIPPKKKKSSSSKDKEKSSSLKDGKVKKRKAAAEGGAAAPTGTEPQGSGEKYKGATVEEIADDEE